MKKRSRKKQLKKNQIKSVQPGEVYERKFFNCNSSNRGGSFSVLWYSEKTHKLTPHKILARRRKFLKVTQVKLAKHCGISQSSVSKIERGDLEPGYTVFFKMLQILKIGVGFSLEKK